MSGRYDYVVGRVRLMRTAQGYGFGLHLDCDYCGERLPVERAELRVSIEDYPLITVAVDRPLAPKVLRHLSGVTTVHQDGRLIEVCAPFTPRDWAGKTPPARECNAAKQKPSAPPTFVAHIDEVLLIDLSPEDRAAFKPWGYGAGTVTLANLPLGMARTPGHTPDCECPKCKVGGE